MIDRQTARRTYEVTQTKKIEYRQTCEKDGHRVIDRHTDNQSEIETNALEVRDTQERAFENYIESILV